MYINNNSIKTALSATDDGANKCSENEGFHDRDRCPEAGDARPTDGTPRKRAVRVQTASRCRCRGRKRDAGWSD